MHKDLNNVSLPISADDAEIVAEPKPFTPDQMVTCGQCNRANAPTRVNCLYCNSALPINEATINLQKPTLRRLEKWELGYNNILVPSANAAENKPALDVDAVADLLKLRAADLSNILSAALPLPVARAASVDEATLIERRLDGFGIATRIVSDADLGVTQSGPTVIRASDFQENSFNALQSQAAAPIQVEWSKLFLIVTGMIISRRVELKEQKSRHDDRILDSSEFFADEAVMDLYVEDQPAAFRLSANNFDFSCLGSRKALVAGENMKTLSERFSEQAPHVKIDGSYQSVRKLLEPVWPTEQQNESSGWRRERPGKYSVGSVTVKTNESQFMRYSLLRSFLSRERRP